MADKKGMPKGAADFCEDLRRNAQKARIKSIITNDYRERARLRRSEHRLLQYARQAEENYFCCAYTTR